MTTKITITTLTGDYDYSDNNMTTLFICEVICSYNDLLSEIGYIGNPDVDLFAVRLLPWGHPIGCYGYRYTMVTYYMYMYYNTVLTAILTSQFFYEFPMKIP